MRIHEYLEICKDEKGKDVIRCRNCEYTFCGSGENYKEHSLVVQEDFRDLDLRFLTSGENTIVTYYQYICPGCGILLEVDSICPELNSNDPIVWDIQLNLGK